MTNLLRPKTLEEFVGQKHLLAPTSALYKLIKQKDIPHSLFFGEAGSGKTSLARIIAKELESDFYEFNATTIKVDELRKVFSRYKDTLIKPVVFIDEIHRLSKNQQEVLLPVMERYDAIIIGASTENPYYTLTSAIRSRSMLFEFKRHTKDDLYQVYTMAKDRYEFECDDEALEYLLSSSNGDARAMLNLLNFAYKVDRNITLDTLKSLRPVSLSDGSSSDESHYNLISAMIKSLRGSDIDASLYYLARLIKGGENPEFIARRLVIFASEDIGNANPNALNLATSTMLSVAKIGYPECRIILSQCAVYLASSPKSNSSYLAINRVLQDIDNGNILNIPKHIQDNHVGYKYPHDYGGYVEQNYLEKELHYYDSKSVGYEKTLDSWIEKIKNIIK
jgi:putative ATPase